MEASDRAEKSVRRDHSSVDGSSVISGYFQLFPLCWNFHSNLRHTNEWSTRKCRQWFPQMPHQKLIAVNKFKSDNQVRSTITFPFLYFLFRFYGREKEKICGKLSTRKFRFSINFLTSTISLSLWFSLPLDPSGSLNKWVLSLFALLWPRPFGATTRWKIIFPAILKLELIGHSRAIKRKIYQKLMCIFHFPNLFTASVRTWTDKFNTSV